MSVPVVKFNVKDQTEFFKELRKRVNKYFKENNISRYANASMKFKSAFMIALYFTPLVLMLVGVITNVWLIMLMWALMGFGMSGIGLSIMHDANHGSYSKNQKVNNAMGWLIHFIGGYRENWKIQHNVLHHSFTNIEGFDEDIEIGIMRFSPTQKRKWMHRFQIFYAPFLYGMMTIYWCTAKDFIQLFRYNKKELLEGQGLTFAKGFMQILFTKMVYFALLIAVPMLLINVTWWQSLIGFSIMHFICGLTLSFVFQPAHVIQETEFYDVDDNGCVDNNWAIHQIKTTSNFANGSYFFSWFIGGLNFQIEHHLFPNICHIHYKKISKIVKETTKEFNLPYHQHKTFFGAIRSHLTLLNQLGTGKYEKNLAKK